jgi:hypothetical protein
MIKRIYLTLSVNASSGFDDFTYKYIFYDTLVKMGYDVVFYPYKEASTSTNGGVIYDIKIISEKIYQNFLNEHMKTPFDLFLSYYQNQQIIPELFTWVKEKTFCVNYTTNFHQISSYTDLLTEADLSIFVSKEAESYFIQNSFRGYYMPFAGLSINLGFNANKNGKISFIGTSYGPRALYLWRCLQNGLPIKIYGSNWDKNHAFRSALRILKLETQALTFSKSAIDTAYRCLNDLIMAEINLGIKGVVNPPLSDEQYNQLISDSSIILNIPESRYNHDFKNPNVLIGANLRDFEVPTLGSLLLTQKNEEIKSFFEENKEVILFSNEWEMVDKAKFYMDRPDLILRVAEAGHNRVKKEHLWEHRFKTFFTYIETNYL